MDAVAYQGMTMPATLTDMYAAAVAHKNNHAVAPTRQTNYLPFANPRNGRGGGRGGDRYAARAPNSGPAGDRETKKNKTEIENKTKFNVTYKQGSTSCFLYSSRIRREGCLVRELILDVSTSKRRTQSGVITKLLRPEKE